MGWRRFLRRRQWDEERARELECHVALETDDNIARGMPPREAEEAARRTLGSAVRIRSDIYAMNSIQVVDWLWQDVRYGVRTLRRSPGFSLATLLTLSLGIGGVTVIYSVIHGVLLDPFPYAHADRMIDVFIDDKESGSRRGRLTNDEWLDFVEHSDVFDAAVGTVSTRPMTMPTSEGTLELNVAHVTANTFAFLEVAPLLGRGLIANDGDAAAPPVIVLSHSAWTETFGQSSSIVGQTVTIGDQPRTIVGIMPPRFAWHVADGWVPRDVRRGGPDANLPTTWLQARLKPAVTLEDVQSQLGVVLARRAVLYPDAYSPNLQVSVITVIDFVVGRFRQVLYTLLAAVGLLLLIACGNVANMQLARASTREREFLLRASLGASRRRLMAHLMMENVLLAFAGAIGGCVVAYLGLEAIITVLPQQGVPFEVELGLDRSALLVALAAAGLACVLFGTVPAWHGARLDLAAGMKESGKGVGTTNARSWLRQALVVGEVGLSLVLILGAGLLMRSFISLTSVDLGFDPAPVAVVNLRFPDEGFSTVPTQQAYLQDAARALGQLPGVARVGHASSWPIGGNRTAVERPGHVTASAVTGLFTLCNAPFFDTLAMVATHGRLLTDTDVARASRVVVVNQALATRVFGDTNPLGHAVRLPGVDELSQSGTETLFEIVGVVPDVRNAAGLRVAPLPAAYVPSTVTDAGPRFLVIRASSSPAPLLPHIQRVARAVDGRVVISGVFGFEEVWQSLFAQARFTLIILTTFAITGLLLVAIGIYGVIAYGVAQRTQEFGIRLALGAQRADVLRGVMWSAARLVLLGASAGLAASVATNRLIVRSTPDVSPYDPWTIGTALVVIAITSLVACLIPALRAARTEPMAALRAE